MMVAAHLWKPPRVAMLLLKLPSSTAEPPASTGPTAVFNVQEVLELCLAHPAAWLQEMLCEENVDFFFLSQEEELFQLLCLASFYG